MVSLGGPTAACGVVDDLKWLVKKAGLSFFPIENLIVKEFLTPMLGHISQPKIPLPISAFINSARLATNNKLEREMGHGAEGYASAPSG